jgi:hypothetical protein
MKPFHSIKTFPVSNRRACIRLRIRNCHRTRHSCTCNKAGVRAHVCAYVTVTERVTLVRATRQVCVHTFARTELSQNASLLYVQQGRCACTRLRVRNCHRTRHSRTHNKTGVRAHVCSHVTFTECIILVRATRQVCVHTFAQTLMSQNASLLYVQQGRRACTRLRIRNCHRTLHSRTCNKAGVHAHVCAYVTVTERVTLVRATRQACVHMSAHT